MPREASGVGSGVGRATVWRSATELLFFRWRVRLSDFGNLSRRAVDYGLMAILAIHLIFLIRAHLRKSVANFWLRLGYAVFSRFLRLSRPAVGVYGFGSVFRIFPSPAPLGGVRRGCLGSCSCFSCGLWPVTCSLLLQLLLAKSLTTHANSRDLVPHKLQPSCSRATLTFCATQVA